MSQIFLICTNEIHKETLWFCFADLLQADLDKVKDYWNTHRIRKSRHGTISGAPDMMYFLPEDFGYSDCIHPVSTEKLAEVESKIEEWRNDTILEDHDMIFHEYFQYVMEKNIMVLVTQQALKKGVFYLKN